MRVNIQTPNGTPVTGGVVTWAMANGSAKSSVTYGLTQSGYIDFPAAPAGNVNVILTNGELPNGVLVSGTFAAVLGFADTNLEIPSPPDPVRTVTVTLPNGLPVANADVEIYSDDMTDQVTRQGFTFKLPNSSLLNVSSDFSDSDWVDDEEYWDFEEYSYWTEINVNIFSAKNVATKNSGATTKQSLVHAESGLKKSLALNNSELVASGTTNTMGRFTVLGFSNSVPDAKVTYDDNVITQTQDVQLQARNTIVELDYIPYVAVEDASITATENVAVTIPVEVVDGNNSMSALQAVNKGVIYNALGKSGVKVKISAPAGAPKYTKGKCKGLASSFVTNSSGKVSTKVCATKSGNYRVLSLSNGTLSMGAVEILVKGAPSTPVRSLKGTSKSHGQINLTWEKPKYLGGASLKSYIVTAKIGNKTITKKLSGSSKSLTLKELKNGKRYTISIVAVTKNGKSDPVKISVPVS
jgi:hypothetical protein